MTSRSRIKRLFAESVEGYFAPLVGAYKGFRSEVGGASKQVRITMEGKDYVVVRLASGKPGLVEASKVGTHVPSVTIKKHAIRVMRKKKYATKTESKFVVGS